MRKLPKERGKKMLTENDTKGAWKFIREATFTVKKDPQNKIDPVVVNDYLASTVQALTATKLHVPHTCDSADSFKMDLVSTRFLRTGEKYYMYFTDNLLLFPTMTEFSKSVNS